MRKIFLTLIVLSMFGTGYLFAQGSVKIGYIDSQTILKQLPEAKKAQKAVQAAVQRVQTSMDSLGQVYQEAVQNYQKQSAIMPAAKKKEAQQKIANMEQEYNSLREKLNANGEVALLNSKLMQPIIDKVEKAAQEVAKKQGIQIVLDNNEQSKTIWYADSTLDLTNKVMDKLITGK